MEPLPPSHFGIESIENYNLVIRDSDVLDLMETILTKTYEKFFGNEGVRFIKIYFQELKNLPQPSSFNTIKHSILKLRSTFSQSDLCNKYHGSFRKLNLTTSLQVIGFDWFSGTVVDIGADDNMLGRMLLENCPTVSKVIGVDIEARHPFSKGDKLEFRRQISPLKLPVAENEADTVVSRYSFHHMSLQEQLSIRDEIARVLKLNGNLIAYENTYSLVIPPLSDSYGFHSKILSLGDPFRIHLLLVALDIFSHGLKRKEMPFTYTYKTVEDWLIFFKSSGLMPVETRYYGIPLIDLHQAPMGVFIYKNRKSETNGAFS